MYDYFIFDNIKNIRPYTPTFKLENNLLVNTILALKGKYNSLKKKKM